MWQHEKVTRMRREHSPFHDSNDEIEWQFIDSCCLWTWQDKTRQNNHMTMASDRVASESEAVLGWISPEALWHHPKFQHRLMIIILRWHMLSSLRLPRYWWPRNKSYLTHRLLGNHTLCVVEATVLANVLRRPWKRSVISCLQPKFNISSLHAGETSAQYSSYLPFSYTTWKKLRSLQHFCD